MKKNLYVMYAIALLQGMVFYGPIATLYRRAQGVTVFQITLIESVSLALAILLEIPWGIAADKIGYRKTMILCSGLYFFSKIVFWKATGFGGFLAERVLLGVVEAGFSGVDASILYLSCQGENSQKVFGIHSSMSMAGLLFAAAVFAAFVRDNYSLAGFLTVASYGLAALLSLGITEVKQPASPSAQPEPFRSTLQKTLANRTLLLFLAASAFLSETHQTITVFLNQLQYQRCGLSSTAIGLVYIAATLLGLLGFCSAPLTKRIGISSCLLFGGFAAVSCAVLGATQTAFPAIAAVLILRISHTLFQPFCAALQNRQIQTENRATALSIHAMLMNGIAIVTNLVFGALSDRSLPLAFFFGAGICVCSLILLSLWHKKMVSAGRTL